MEIVHTSEIIIIFGLLFIEIDASYGFGGPLRGIKTQSVVKIVST